MSLKKLNNKNLKIILPEELKSNLSWENPSIETILYQHNKFYLTDNEKEILKILLFKKSPPLDIRIQVRIKK